MGHGVNFGGIIDKFSVIWGKYSDILYIEISIVGIYWGQCNGIFEKYCGIWAKYSGVGGHIVAIWVNTVIFLKNIVVFCNSMVVFLNKYIYIFKFILDIGI